MDCVFCEIIAGNIPCKKVYEDENVLAIEDINPQAETHVLLLTKQHICCANSIDAGNVKAVADVFLAVPAVAETLGVKDYRIINNCGEGAGQTVKHLHFHLLAGPDLAQRLV